MGFIIIIIIIINIINFEVDQVSYIGVSVYWYEICRSELNADYRCVLRIADYGFDTDWRRT